MGRRSLRTLLLAAVAAMTVAAPAAAADPPLQVVSIDTHAWPQTTVTVKTTDPSAASALQVKENDQAAANVRIHSDSSQSAVALVIDTSDSMHGQKLADAEAAAATFVTGAQSGDVMGLYGFGAKPYVVTALPATSSAVVTGLGQLATGGPAGTAIYSGVQMAAQALQAQHASTKAIVLLTDGSSANESTTLDQAVSAAKAAHATIYSVGIEGSGSGQDALQTLASSYRPPTGRP
jgi:Mg-chelatase subunit ChlD